MLSDPPPLSVSLSQAILPGTTHLWHPGLSHKDCVAVAYYTLNKPLASSPKVSGLAGERRFIYMFASRRVVTAAASGARVFCPLRPPLTLRASQPSLTLPLLDLQVPNTHPKPQSAARGLQPCPASLPGKRRKNKSICFETLERASPACRDRLVF